VVDGLETQVAHGHGVDLGVNQGHGEARAPFPHHRAFFLGQQLLQAGFDFGRHEIRFSVFSFQFSVKR
jgi:hypothetical protein